MSFLTVAAMFKNERHIIQEWIGHYLHEGADSFLLIDNGSTDDGRSRVAEYVDSGVVTIVEDAQRWAQVELYNRYFGALKGRSEWVLICDLDEFVYARRGYQTVASFLRDLPAEVGVVRIPWKVFGSSGHVEQPGAVVPSFLRRARVGVKRPWGPYRWKELSKVIVRPERVEAFQIHFVHPAPGCGVVSAGKRRLSYRRDHTAMNFQPISERFLATSYLHLNHYPLQSRNWFLDVKGRRGDADSRSQENVRTLSYFETYDAACDDLLDDELAKKAAGRP